jgi:hypothetical protein
MGEFPYTNSQILSNKIKTRGLPVPVPNEKFLSSAMSHSAGQKFAIKLLGEFENILGYQSGA